MKATDLPLLTSVSRPTVHPDGTRVVFATSRPNLDADAYVGQLWSVPVDGSRAPRRISRGVKDSAPQFSPDGSRIGFLRSDGDGPAQLNVMDAVGGEPTQVTDSPLGVSSFRWSPDGRRLAFTARIPEDGRYGTVKELGPAAEPPRLITTRRYRSNGLGYTIDRRSHIFLVEAPDPGAEPVYRAAPSAADPTPDAPRVVPEARQLTRGDFDNGAMQFSPDGLRVGFISARHDDRDIDLANGIYELPVDEEGAEPVALTRGEQKFSISGFRYAPDGSVVFIASELGNGRDFIARNESLYRLDNQGHATRLTDPETVDLSEGQASVDFTLRPDGAVLAVNRTAGSSHLVEVSPDGTLVTLTSGALEVHGHDTVFLSEASHSAASEPSADGAHGVTVVSFADATTAGDIAVLRDGKLASLTNFSAELAVAGIAPLTELTITVRDGYAVHGWVLVPRGNGPHPVLLNIHGGPFTQYTASVFDEAQVYVDAGYAVVMCNPRGSAGYGQEHGRSIRQRMGTLDFADVIDFLDGALAAQPSLDANRVGIMGGSYGGYLTAWIIAHDHRFAGAIVERGYLDPEAFIGTSDIGDFFTDEYTGVDPEAIRGQSPQAVVDQVTTPTLVIHSENDLRCPLPQGERYYAALKRAGVDARLLVFPGENHELSRSGRPRHRLQRFEAILDWWSRYLPVGVR